MANYQETNVSGTSYTRANQIVVSNPLNGVKAISFMEEQVVNLEGEQIFRQKGGIQEPFTAENIQEEFPLLNPEDGTPLGITTTYQQVYVTLYSLYMHLATKRDTPAPAPAPVEPPPVPVE